MNLDKETLEHELEGLRLQLRQAEAQVHMVLGAIQTINQLLAILDKPESAKEVEE